MTQEGRQEEGHAVGEHWVIAVVLIRLADRSEDGTQSPLAALGHDDLAGSGQIGGDSAE